VKLFSNGTTAPYPTLPYPLPLWAPKKEIGEFSLPGLVYFYPRQYISPLQPTNWKTQGVGDERGIGDPLFSFLFFFLPRSCCNCTQWHRYNWPVRCTDTRSHRRKNPCLLCLGFLSFFFFFPFVSWIRIKILFFGVGIVNSLAVWNNLS
jgi:hypothetical protein